MKCAFVCDSGTGRSIKEMKNYGVYSLPLQISDEKQNYLELEDKSIEMIYSEIQEGKMLKTSLPPIGLIEEVFTQIKNEGYDTIFAVPICNGLSSTCNAMRLGAKSVGLNFISIDTFVTAEVEFRCVLLAKELYEQGKSIDEIKEVLNRLIDSASTLLIPVDLNHLKRGGRLTPLAATLGGLLKIKPILKVDKSTQGKIDVMAKVRTLGKAMDQVVGTMVEAGVDSTYKIFIAYVLNKEECELMSQKIKDKIHDSKVEVIELVSCVGCHTGIGCIAIQYYQDQTA